METTMTYSWGGWSDANVDVTYDFASDVEMEFKTDVEYKSDTYVDTDIDVKVDVEGNSAVFNVDVQAIGDDGAVELNLVSFTTDNYAGITMTGFSVVD
jgi:hypothetical protein